MEKVGALLLVLLALAGCGPSIYETYDYTKEYDPRKHEYVIGVSDQINIAVYKMPDLSSAGTVRPDGVITIPLIGDLLVAGKAPSQVREDIQEEAVGLHQRRRHGERHGDGLQQLPLHRLRERRPHRLVRPEVLRHRLRGDRHGRRARQFAGDQVVLIRSNEKGKPREIPISYKMTTSGRHPEMDLAVVAGDTILVQ